MLRDSMFRLFFFALCYQYNKDRKTKVKERESYGKNVYIRCKKR